MTEETCPIHNKPRIHSYNDKNYCKDCLDELFEAIYKAKEVLNKKT